MEVISTLTTTSNGKDCAAAFPDDEGSFLQERGQKSDTVYPPGAGRSREMEEPGNEIAQYFVLNNVRSDGYLRVCVQAVF